MPKLSKATTAPKTEFGTRLRELAEYFDLPEDDIKKALHYWTECRGVDFNKE